MTAPLCVSDNKALALLYKNVYIILVKDFSTCFLPETRHLVYGMKTFSGTPTGAVYYISLKLCV